MTVVHERPKAFPVDAIIAGTPVVVGLAGFIGSPEAMDALGKDIAILASAATGTIRLVATVDTDAVLRQSIRNWIYPSHLLEEWHLDSDDADYAGRMQALARGI